MMKRLLHTTGLIFNSFVFYLLSLIFYLLSSSSLSPPPPPSVGSTAVEVENGFPGAMSVRFTSFPDKLHEPIWISQRCLSKGYSVRSTGLGQCFPISFAKAGSAGLSAAFPALQHFNCMVPGRPQYMRPYAGSCSRAIFTRCVLSTYGAASLCRPRVTRSFARRKGCCFTEELRYVRMSKHVVHAHAGGEREAR